MVNIAIICHLERLWPNYKTGQAYFGLNLSASFDKQAGTRDDALNLLLPWMWEKISSIHVRIRKPDGTELPPVTATPIEFPAGGTLAPLMAAIKKEAEAIWNDPADGPDSFVWNPTIGTSGESDTRRYLRNLLGYVSTLPAPAPQRLNLSLCFSLPNTAFTADDLIFAAPEFQSGTLGNAKPRDEGPDQQFRVTPPVYNWPYKNTPADVQIAAYIVPWKVEASPSSNSIENAKRFIDLSSYWVRRSVASTQPDWYGSDWTVRMETKVANAFDMAQRLVDAFRKLIKPEKAFAALEEPEQRKQVLSFFRRAVVASVHDLASVGVVKSADGTDLAGYLLGSCQDAELADEGIFESLKLTMRGVLEYYNRTLTEADWRELLKNQLTAIKATAAIRNPSEDRLRAKLEEEAAELDQIQSALADKGNLQKIFLAQWTAATEKGGDISNIELAGKQRAEYFLSDAAKLVDKAKDVALLNLGNGQTWVVTLADINHVSLAANSSYFFRVIDANKTNQFSIEAKRESASNQLKLTLLDADGTALVQKIIANPDTCYHLRLQITRSAQNKLSIRPQFADAVNNWQPFDAAKQVVELNSALTTGALVVELVNSPGSFVKFMSPSVLFAKPEDLQKILAAWDRQIYNKAKMFWERCAPQIETNILPTIELRQRLAQSNIGRIWTNLIALSHADPDEFQQIENNLKKGLKDYFAERILREVVTLPPLYRDYVQIAEPLPLPADVRTVIEVSFDEFVVEFKRDLLPLLGSVVEEGDDSPSEISPGITIQVDRLSKFTEDDSDDANDLLRKVAGIGVLMRQRKQVGGAMSPWRCLNMAELHAVDADNALKPVYDRAVVPYRVSYQNDLRQALVSYNDAPLIAKSKAVELAREVNLEQEGGDPLPAQLEYLAANKTAVDWAALPPLKFGQAYDLLAFAIGNSGALPKELVPADGHPASLLSSTANFTLDETKFKDFIRPVKYLRRVRVGKARFGNGQAQRPPFPKISEQVTPLAGELKLNPSSISGVQLPDPTQDMILGDGQPSTVQAGSQNLPLALLWQVHETTPLTFNLLKPTTDLTTWNRWMAKEQDADPAIADRRREVIADFYRQAPKPGDDPSREFDISLDDPAMANFFVAELVPMKDPVGNKRSANLKETATPANGQAVVVNIQSKNPAAGIALAQSKPVMVKCTRAARSTKSSISGGQELSVTVEQGDVLELRIYVPVEAKWFDDPDLRRFHKLKELPTAKWLQDGKQYYLLSPVRVILESVSEAMPKAEDIWKAIKPDFFGQRLSVRFERGSMSLTNKFDNVASVDLQRQIWRWQGRPVTTFPAISNNDQANRLNAKPIDNDSAATNAVLWDAEGFGDRGDDDHLLTTSKALLRETAPLMFEEDRSQDRRALYYRFAAIAYSRYRGLLRPTEDDPRPDMVESKSTITGDRWRRFVVNCRWLQSESSSALPKQSEKIPKPQVKFVVPLTEADTKSEKGDLSKAQLPGLLVVLNETWYEVGGVAESLKAELLEVKDPAGNLLPEIGPDPILSAEAWPGGKAELKISQPLGHTFDTDTDAPLFVASSCELRLPDIPAKFENDWCLAKLSFKRSLIVNGDVEVESKPTDPFWIQLPPDFSKFGDSLEPEKLRVRRETSSEKGIWIVKEDGSGANLPLDPKSSGFNKFARWVLLTQVIGDMRGRRDQERYLGLYRIGKEGFCRPMNDRLELAENWRLRARIVEAQYRVETLSDVKSSVSYYDGTNLAGGAQWAITLAGIETSFGNQNGGFTFSLSKSGALGESLLNFAVGRNGVTGEVQITAQQHGQALSSPLPLFGEDANQPFSLQMRLTRKQDGTWAAIAECQPGGKLAETVIEKLADVAVKISLNSSSAEQQLSYVVPSITAEPWDHLFPPEEPGASPEDARARFVRVSRPIEMVGSDSAA